jgi:hypothetical protein
MSAKAMPSELERKQVEAYKKQLEQARFVGRLGFNGEAEAPTAINAVEFPPPAPKYPAIPGVTEHRFVSPGLYTRDGTSLAERTRSPFFG